MHTDPGGICLLLFPDIKVHAHSFCWCSFPATVPGISPPVLPFLSLFHTWVSVTQWGHARVLCFSLRLEQNLAVPGCVRGAWGLLQRWGSSSFWCRRRRWQETGERPFAVGHSWNKIPALLSPGSCLRSSLNVCSFTFLSAVTVCWQIHSEGRLWKGRRPGAHGEEWGDGGAAQAGGWWAVVRKQPQGNVEE